MGTAVRRVDVVGEGEDVLGVRVVVLERDLDDGRILAPLDVDRARIKRFLVLVQVADEGNDPSLKIERAFPIGTIVDQADPQTLVQVGRLAQALGDRVEGELDRLEHSRVRLEQRFGARPVALGPESANRRCGSAARVLLSPDVTVSRRLDPQPFGQRIYNADADAVQSARDLIAAAAELPAGVENGVHDF